MINNRISKTMPYSYLWTIKRFFGPNVETILDLGCGDGSFMKGFSKGENWKITGVDVHRESIKKARKLKMYDELIVADGPEALSNFLRKGNRFDVVFCSQVLEHLTKEKGEKLLKLAEKIANKKVVITTPQGYVRQEKEYIDENPHQEHKSGWSRKDFVSRGYSVYGLGFKPVWAEQGFARSNYKVLTLPSRFFSYFVSPLILWMPTFAAGLIAVKNKS